MILQFYFLFIDPSPKVPVKYKEVCNFYQWEFLEFPVFVFKDVRVKWWTGLCLFGFTQSALSAAAVFAVMEQTQRWWADREGAGRKPGQQTQPALLLVIVVIITIWTGLILFFILRGLCVGEKTVSTGAETSCRYGIDLSIYIASNNIIK